MPDTPVPTAVGDPFRPSPPRCTQSMMPALTTKSGEGVGGHRERDRHRKMWRRGISARRWLGLR